jgi:hypothetical protein
MPALSRAEILARKVRGAKTERVPLGDGYVVVRGLTRGESHETVDKSTRETEIIGLHYGIVEPTMSMADISAWMDNDESGAFQPIINMIQKLSGNAEGQGKEYTKSLSGDGSGTTS